MPRSHSRFAALTAARMAVCFAIAALSAGCAAAPKTSERAPADGGYDDFDLGAMMAAHRTVPDAKLSGTLGSETNPIRARGPQGQRDYLARLRCANGRAPEFERGGSLGLGPYDRIVDLFTLHCENGPVRQVTMDMYHCVEETRPIEGFEIVERVIPIANFGGCPE
ncbi:MAG: hypothetical protein KA144_07780 [Xanthomonadaceae bacterium]|nr:hypothetical protein [Xanthomonadaceae bacterium]